MFTINDDSIDKVDSLASSVQVNLGPIVFAWRGVSVARWGSWGDTSVPGIRGRGYPSLLEPVPCGKTKLIQPEEASILESQYS